MKTEKYNKNYLFEMVNKLDPSFKINEAKKEEKWMQKALGKTKEKPEGKHPGALHKDLGIPEDQKIPMSLINKKIKELEKASEGDKKLSKKELKLLHRLIAAKNMKEVNESLENENINDFINETITNIDDIILD